MHSIVIAAYNEAPTLESLVAEIQQVAKEHDLEVEVIIVDDGSTDDSWIKIQSLASQNVEVRGIRLRRNFGKATALAEGFAAARGALVITMDADMQDDPAEIPKFVEKVEDGIDVVSGWKKKRNDPFSRVIASRAFNWLVRRITGVKLHDHNCGFKCCRREVLNDLQLYGELHRFIPVLASSLGYTVGEVAVNHRPRAHGTSRYGIARIPKGLLDLVTVQFLTSFRHRPQHLLGTIGLIGFAAGTLLFIWLAAWWFISRAGIDGIQPIHLHERPIFFVALAAMILGSQFLAVGFLGELIVAMMRRSGSEAPVSVSERIGFEVQPRSETKRRVGEARLGETIVRHDDPQA